MPQPESRADTTRRPYPRFLIVVLALFVCIIEVVATVSLKFLLDANSPHAGDMVFFLIAFPSLLSLLFFFTLWLRRDSAAWRELEHRRRIRLLTELLDQLDAENGPADESLVEKYAGLLR